MRENITSQEVYLAILEAVSVAQQRKINMKKNRLPPMTDGSFDSSGVHVREHVVRRGGKVYRKRAHTRKAPPKKKAVVKKVVTLSKRAAVVAIPAQAKQLVKPKVATLFPKGHRLNGTEVAAALWSDIDANGYGGIWLLPDGGGVNVGFAGHVSSVHEGMSPPPGADAYDFAGSFGFVHVSIGMGECNLDTWAALTTAQQEWLNTMFTRLQGYSRRELRASGRMWNINASIHHADDKWLRLTLGAQGEQATWQDFINSTGVLQEGA
jgi:hypothetical protein